MVLELSPEELQVGSDFGEIFVIDSEAKRVLDYNLELQGLPALNVLVISNDASGLIGDQFLHQALVQADLLQNDQTFSLFSFVKRLCNVLFSEQEATMTY